VKWTVILERLAIVIASLALSFGLIALLSGFFAGRDQAGVSVSAPPVGAHYPDQGHARLKPGQQHPPYDSVPPTSGPHVPVPVLHDQSQLSDDQLLTALAAGNVVVMYGSPTPPRSLVAFARQQAGPFSPGLAESGGAVILAQRPGTVGLIGLAWAHMIHVPAASDPLLGQFTQYWLGRGAPGH
jgi:hypothetical protein